MNDEIKDREVTDAEEALLPEAEVGATDYWKKSASTYTLMARILTVALVLFLVFFSMFYSRAFSHRGFHYFVKDLLALAGTSPEQSGKVYYTPSEGESHIFAFRGGVAQVNTTGVEVCSADGRRLLRVEHALTTPRAACSRKYLVAYDFGGTSFVVCNSYAELYRAETADPISYCAVSDSGHFLLVTRSENALTSVLLYNASCEQIQKFERASATIGAAVSDNGSYVALVGLSLESGEKVARLDVFEIGKAEPRASVRLNGEVPLRVDFLSSRQLVLLTDKGTYTYQTDGKQLGSVAHGEDTPYSFAVGDASLALVLKTDSATTPYRILVVNRRGEALYNSVFADEVIAASLFDGVLFLLSPDRVTRVDLGKGETDTVPCTVGAVGLSALADDRVQVFYEAVAVYVSFDD